MTDGNIVVCASSAYDRKYYFNQTFAGLPDQVKDELKVMSVVFTESVGGIFALYFGNNGSLCIDVSSKEADARFDDIGSALEIKRLQKEKRELFEALENYFKIIICGK